jgi:sterol desaturase/sphingolipid hydroxylase (fatty acid hydroxylase superfamily)
MDWTVVAIPGYFASMGAEYVWLKHRAERDGPSPVDYERQDTITSLTMGVASLLSPMVMPTLLGPITPGKGRYGKALVIGAAGAAAVTTVADVLARLDPGDVDPGAAGPAEPAPPTSRARRRRIARAARRVASVAGVAAVAAGGVAITTALAHRIDARRLFDKRVLPDLGSGPAGFAVAMVGWDLLYYWNHRFMHSARYMWAIHVVHHSSERYNLSTALRQPVADAFGTFVPYSLLCLLGVRPELVLQARGLNLLYQYWIHTDAIRTIGPLEEVLNTPSHHRVHHGVNPQYLDRNHGGILISWDRLFGTFEREDEPVVYGLTKNINTFNPVRVASHEHVEMLRDAAQSTTWRDRLSYVVRGPGWAYARHAERDGAVAMSSASV